MRGWTLPLEFQVKRGALRRSTLGLSAIPASELLAGPTKMNPTGNGILASAAEQLRSGLERAGEQIRKFFSRLRQVRSSDRGSSQAGARTLGPAI
jgi:hypothetical protein